MPTQSTHCRPGQKRPGSSAPTFGEPAVIGVQTSLLKALPLYFTTLILLPALQALAAGYLWRRYQRPWLVTIAYAERIIPLALTLIWSAALVWGAIAALQRED